MKIIKYDTYDVHYYSGQWRRVKLYVYNGNSKLPNAFCYNIEFFFFCNPDGLPVATNNVSGKSIAVTYVQQR